MSTYKSVKWVFIDKPGTDNVWDQDGIIREGLSELCVWLGT